MTSGSQNDRAAGLIPPARWQCFMAAGRKNAAALIDALDFAARSPQCFGG
jgi:hypothetical protein